MKAHGALTEDTGINPSGLLGVIQSCLAMRSSAAGGVQGLALSLAKSLKTARET